ncbi:MAG: iron-sulfur cluster repair di-iron protein [Gemmatimonadales bacterium]|jgi:regulator of cell morphogenesis and NO signaling|nr:iron-sulfur cluster repair di-iron protein [Gemmatimonadales bacterium]
MQPITTPLGELAAANPSATRVFLRHRLDFCCGGRRTLAEACERAGLNPAEIAAELEQEATRGDSATRWGSRSQTELADHIEGHYHAGLRRDLPPLIEAARKVERVHATKPGVPSGLADVLTEFFAEMQSHMGKEEKILFPMIRRSERAEAVYMPVRMMEGEHDSHREQLVKIRELTDDLRLPVHACATWTALYHGLETVEAELMQHIHLENNILFSRATRGAG